MSQQFDYVIIGAGTAGCVLANRLSADAKTSVCLIEAGPPDNTILTKIPSFVGTLLFHPRYSWGYKSTPQPQLNGRQILLPRGRILGGCSSTNGMVYFRGHPRDFDEWAAMGNTGWSFREVLPYFLRSENNDDHRDSPWHGTQGEMHVSHVSRYNPMIKPFLAATEALGYGRCEDFHGTHDPIGFDVRQNAIHKGLRVSGVSAFLDPIRHRNNMHIVTDALVHRIEVSNGRATGVTLERGGMQQTITANREVLLCGGAYGSPAVLQHSGIGDATLLNQLGIEVKLHLPAVGQNLHDHPSAVVQMKTDNTESYGISLPALPRNAWSVLQYLFARKGQFSTNLFEVTGFLRTIDGLDRPDVQLVFMPANRPNPGQAFPHGHGFGVNSILLRPKSRGSVTLGSPDPHESPLIDNAFLRDAADIEPLLRGIRIARKILARPELGKYRASEILPGPSIDKDDELRDYIKRMCSAVHHPGGSCRMGGDAASVVDPQLKLRGIDALRVVDCSIFPRMVSGNSNAGAVMVAEKAADMILGKPALAPIDF
ncbi:MAG TPA: GMC family oxidoreductase N-terminal domain-containing protein [Candidatus Acidoferrum sp.]|nr:GMC family oxidoreductase N-terminal domain-containing protein [Candidatus Acidoferrum sp.]